MQEKTMKKEKDALNEQLIEMESLAATPKAAQNKAITKYQKIKIKKTRTHGSDLESKNYSVHLCRENESIYTLRSEKRADAACQTETGVDQGM